jgi:hypothetical protein
MNEIIEEDLRTWNGWNDNWIKIIYKATEHPPKLLKGTIYLGHKERYYFYSTPNKEALRFVFDNRNLLPPQIVFGQLRLDGTLSFTWDGDPGDHTICVSYDFDEERQKELPNWKKEGF